MELSSLTKISSNNNNHGRNYTLLDIKEKIKILHKINSNSYFQKYSFDKSNERNAKNKNLNLLSSTLPSSLLTKNHVYKKKLVKHNSIKNSPNIFVIKNSKSENKTYNKDKIINEIKNNEILRNSVKNELKNEIIEEFLEDIAKIDEQKIQNFLKIKNLLLTSEKIKKNIFPKNTSNDNTMNSNIITTTNENLITEQKCFSTKNCDNRFIIDLNNKNNNQKNYNKKGLANVITPVKTIFNNLFINNNEKYIIKNPLHEHENKSINKKKSYIIRNGEIKLSNFNFQIINSQENNNKNNCSFEIFTKKSNFILDDNLSNNNKKIIINKKHNIKEKMIKNLNEMFKKENKINSKNIKHSFYHINKKNIMSNKRYYQDLNLPSDNTYKSLKMKEYEKNIFKDSKKEKIQSKLDKKNNNIEKINSKNKVKIVDEKRKILIKKIIEDSKKILKNKKILNDSKYLGKLFIMTKNFRNNSFTKGQILNKSFISGKNKKIKLKQINYAIFNNTYSEHKERNKTFSNFLKENKSNIFRICHIKKYFKVLKKDNNKHLLNTKWLKNISKKNIPLLCFDKK